MEWLTISQIKKAVLSILISPLLLFFSPVAMLVQALLWLVIIDIISGMYSAKFADKKDLTSRGFLKKLVPLSLFFLALTASLHSGVFFAEFGIDKIQPAKWVISFYGLYELFSILENLGKCGLPIAKQISVFLKQKLPNEVKFQEEKKNDTNNSGT